MFKDISRDLRFITLSLFLWGLGEGMFLFFQPIYLDEYWKADPVTIGAIYSAMGVFMTIAQLPAGWLSDRSGPRPAMWASWILGLAAAVVMAAAETLPIFLTGMFLYGLTSFVIAPMNLYMTAVRGAWPVERALTISSAAFNAGMVLGSLSSGFISDAYDFRMLYITASVFFCGSTILVLFCRKPPRDEHHEATAHRPNLFRNTRFLGLVGLIFVTLLVLYFPQPMTSLFFSNENQLSRPVVGLLGSVSYLGNAVLAFGLQRVSAPVGFLVGQALVALYALILWQAQSPVWFGVGVFVLGGYRLVRVMTLAYARRFIRAAETGMAYGIIETANGAVVIIAPYLAGLVFTRSPRMLFGIAFMGMAAVLLVNLAYNCCCGERRKPV